MPAMADSPDGSPSSAAPGSSRHPGAGNAPVAPVIAVDEVRARLAAGDALVLADVRWYLDGRDGRAAYAAGHLPGAVWVDVDRDLAAHGGPATEGRHPLPSPAAFAASMTRLGIGDDTLVVAYDDTGGMTAGRLVVMLRMLGRPAALLDGGLSAWPDGLETGEVVPVPHPVGFGMRQWPAERLVSTAALLAWVRTATGQAAAPADTAATEATAPPAAARAEVAMRAGAVLLDARPYERFTGAVAAVDPRPGHVPGARSAPWSAVLGSDGRLRPREELRAHFTALGVADADEVVVSCGSGVSACLDIVALEHAGFAPARLYPPSWSGWSADPARPAALGD